MVRIIIFQGKFELTKMTFALVSDIFRLFGRPAVYQFERPNSSTPKSTFKAFFFQFISTKNKFK